MKESTILQAIGIFLRLLDRASKGDMRAVKRLEHILPKRTHTRIAREAQAAKDRAKYGPRRR